MPFLAFKFVYVIFLLYFCAAKVSIYEEYR